MRHSPDALRTRLQSPGLVFDGAMGSLIEARRADLPPFDCAERLVLESGETITDIHRQYFAAGAEVVETCTFGGTPHKLSLYGLEKKTREINFTAALLARQAALDFPGALVAGSKGPTGLLSIEKRTEFKDFFRNFYVQAEALLLGGVDILLLETCNDLLEAKAGVLACRDAIAKTGVPALVAVSFSVDKAGRLLLGTRLDAAALTVDHLGVDLIGVNCSMGPDGLAEAAAELPRLVSTPLLVMPNRGLPENIDGRAVYTMPSEAFAEAAACFRAMGFQSVGGCCGTTPRCIELLRDRLAAAPTAPGPAAARTRKPALTGFIDILPLDSGERPLIVGERLNYHGSRKFRAAVDNHDLEAIVSLSRDQLARGARILDVCLATRDPQRQLDLVRRIIPQLSVNAAAPLMFDTTDLEAMAEVCQHLHGRGVLNSCNLEHPDRSREIFRLARRYGHMVVCLPVAEGGVPMDAGARVENAVKLVALAAAEGLAPSDLMLDPLILTLATGRPEDRGNARLALDTLARFKHEIPGAFTIMGVSNVSFGLPASLRPVLNNALLRHAAAAGLDVAIFNPMELAPPESFPPELMILTEELLFDRRPDALERLLAAGRPVEKAGAAEPEPAAIDPPEHLRRMIVQRQRDGYFDLLARVAVAMPPQAVVETVFLPAMAEGGRLMEERGLPLPYVLDAASMAQEGLQYLKRMFPVTAAAGRGRVVLATVKGDVHDIGKNLVRMLLAHSGLEVEDLGTDVPAERILQACRERPADAIGLSALLVSTSREMKSVVGRLHQEGFRVPVLIGGAAVTEAYALELLRQPGGAYPGGVFYGKDAFQGLRLVEQLLDPGRRQEMQRLQAGRAAEQAEARSSRATPAETATPAFQAGESPAFLDATVRTFCGDIGRLIRDFNFEKQCGRKLMAKGQITDGFYYSLLRTGESLLQQMGDSQVISPMAVHGRFPVRLDGNRLTVEHAGDRFPLSLNPACWPRLFQQPDGPVLPLMVVTLGGRLNELVRRRFEEGDYLQGYILSMIGAELADEFAELATRVILEELAISRRQAVRYSPGYPAWPALVDQLVFFHLLGAEHRIGVRLSEAFQMIPEFSVSAGLLYRDAAPRCP